jgi:peptide-methionine (S)-S-oxide reductase
MTKETLLRAAAPLLLASLVALSGACSAGDAPNDVAEPVAQAADGVPSSAQAPEPSLAPVEGASATEGASPETAAEPSATDANPDPASPAMTDATPEAEESPAPPAEEVATLGAGCFWCIEAVLEQVEGVKSVVSGYTGGQTEDPTYKDICTGQTGHAEVVKVTFDPSVITYAELLDWFWRLHDPTTLNRQGNDRGTQYRSAIFYHSEDQRRIAETSKKDVQPSFDDPIVTEVTAAATFYPAEQYHQGYYFDNSSQGYCRMVIAPKLKKLGLKY